MKISLPHDSAHTHVSGLSEYVDDRIAHANEVYVELVYSPYAHAKIKKMETKKALAYPGVLAVYTADDFHTNLWGTIFKDQPLLAKEEVQFAGEPIAIVAATDRNAAA